MTLIKNKSINSLARVKPKDTFISNNELNASIQRDAARLLYDNALPGILITIITSTFLVFSFSVPAAEQFKYIWWVLMMSLLCVRLIDWKIWTRPNKDPHFDGKKAILRFVFGANLTAIMWSVYVVTVIVNSNTSDINLIAHLIIVSAIAGGSATVLAGHKLTAIFFSFILLVPASLALIASGIQEQRMLGILGLLFGLVMVAISKKTRFLPPKQYY